MSDEKLRKVMGDIRDDARRMSSWSEDWIVQVLRTAGKDLKVIRDGIDLVIRQQEFMGKGDDR